MASLILSLAVLFQIGVSSDCSLLKSKLGEFEIHIGKKSMPAPVISESAQLEKCSPWPGFPHLYVAELLLGEGGTTHVTWRTDLLVIDSRNKNLNIRYQKILRSGQVDEKGKHLKPDLQMMYRLSKNKSGKPILYWGTEGNHIKFD